MEIRKELPHFYIGDSLGGQQEWYSRITDFGMNVGGCAAITALSVRFRKNYSRRLFKVRKNNGAVFISALVGRR